MRKLVIAAIGFAASSLASVLVLWNAPILFFGLAVLPAAAGLLLCRRFRTGTALLGAALGFLWFFMVQKVYWEPLQALEMQIVKMQIRCLDYSEKSLYGSSVEGRTELDGKSYRVLVYLNGDVQLLPGDILEGNFHVRLTIPGGSKASGYQQGNGIFLQASQRKEMTVISGDTQGIRYLPARLRHRVGLILGHAMPPDVLPFARALLLGDTQDLDYKTSTAFQVSGIRHIIAVSGLHVAILYGIVLALSGRNRILSCLLGIPVLFLFAAVAGFTPSVSRASLMTGAMLAAGVMSREYDPPSELAFASVVLMLINPMVVMSASFQLSITSVAGILLVSKRIQSFLTGRLGCAEGKNVRNHLLHGCCASLSVTLGAQLFTLPLSAYYFGAVSLISPLTNLLTLWVVSTCFCGILVTASVGFFSVTAAKLAGAVTAVPMRYILMTARLLSCVPMAAVYTVSLPICIWIASCYLFLVLGLWKKPLRRYLGAAAAAGFLLAMTAAAIPVRRDAIRLTVLDVGQGQCLLLQSKGKTIMVDCGGRSDAAAADAAAQWLLSRSIYRIDGILVTHYDADHIGGIANFLTRIPADTLYLPKEDADGKGLLLSQSADAETIWLDSTERMTLGAADFTVLYAPQGKTRNENSLGVLFETENCAILVTGDRNLSGEKALIQSGLLRDVDALVAGHHGSKNATSLPLLEAVTPETVLISVGKGNSFGHPAQEMLERVENLGCTVLRTDERGTIVYRR